VFDWLVKVRYLAGNPWTAAKDPVVIGQAEHMQVDRALSRNAWDTVVEVLTPRAAEPHNQQDRVALAAILLMGDSVLRRAEAASARQDKLKASRHASGVWILTVLGKRSKIRKVPISCRTIDALRAHWRVRGLDIDSTPADLPLLAPLVVPARRRRGHGTDTTT
jgi:site-specific recombinase XerC